MAPQILRTWVFTPHLMICTQLVDVQNKGKAILTIQLETSKLWKSAWIVFSCLQMPGMFSLRLPSWLWRLVPSAFHSSGYKHLNVYFLWMPQRIDIRITVPAFKEFLLTRARARSVCTHSTPVGWNEQGGVHEDGTYSTSGVKSGGGEGEERLRRHRGRKNKWSWAGTRVLVSSL